ncbi:MAG: hypothetical protein GY764_01185, partial [Halieaceae bacterium]|nr:hypothetical protein [Halieaceae bacterium]
MAITVDQAHIDTFEDTVRQLAQQSTSRAEQAVTIKNKQSSSHAWDRLAASEARQKTSARMVSPAGGNGSGAVGSTDGLEWTRRTTVIKTYDTGEVVEKEDIVQMLIDPKSASTENLVMNLKRKKDDVIFTAGLADAADGAGGVVSFPAGQIVGDYTGEISLDFVTEVDEKFCTNDIDLDEPKFWFIGPKQRRKLLQLIEVTSSDFQGSKAALATGYLPSFIGFNWVVTNRLNVPDADQLDNLVMTKKALGLHVASDIEVSVGERTDMSFA